MSPFKRVLVANGGEIALRIIRACHEEGLEAVAVYSEADRLSPHVRAADRAVPLGAAPASESYLNIPKLIAAARTTECQALHPGYGFLSERAPFAEAVAAAGLVFVGPPPEAIRAMGDKTAARRRMQAARGPIVPRPTKPPGRGGEARPEAARLGYPVLLKAAAGGGGKGMRLVREERELGSAFEAARSEALKAFGAGEVYLEKYLERARHVEVQILADANGRVVALGERECSIQRRHQKLIEEAPSVAVTPALRRRISDAATAAARSLRPPAGPGVRWDGGVEAGNEVPLFYDPLIAKLIAWGETREVALQRMRRALRELVIVGLPTSQAFHLRVMDEPRFRRGEVDSTYLERVGSELLAQQAPAELARPLAAVAALLAEERRAAAHPPAPSDGRGGRESAWVQTARRENLRGGAE